MNQLSRASMKWSRLIVGLRPPSAASSVAPKPFSTEASEPKTGSPANGVAYGRLIDITKYTTKADILIMLDDSNLSPEKILVEYNRSFYPTAMLLAFPSPSAYDAALRSINRKGRMYNLKGSNKNDWDAAKSYDGKAVLLIGLARTTQFEDVERFLSGCQFDSTSVQFIMRNTSEGLTRMAFVSFPTRAMAMHAYITKNKGFCQNNQIRVQVLH